MVPDALAEAESRMKGAVHAVEEALASLRTGRASPTLVEKLPVEYYGTPTPLIQLATISAPEPRLLTIRPFDPGSVKDIERALLASDLGLTPNIYLNTLRMEAAIDKLTTSSEAVTSIGLDLGFSSQASFTRFFASNVGIPPSDYRRVAHLAAA